MIRSLIYSLLVSLMMCIGLQSACAQQDSLRYPANDGDRMTCSVFIKSQRGDISGVCVLLNEAGSIKGAIVNEFGVTALDFTYNPDKDKVELNHVIAMLDKWYVRGVLREDIRQLLGQLRQGRDQYVDERYHITYQLVPIAEDKDLEDNNSEDNDTEEPTLQD